jgi:hypothetical protein
MVYCLLIDKVVFRLDLYLVHFLVHLNTTGNLPPIAAICISLCHWFFNQPTVKILLNVTKISNA